MLLFPFGEHHMQYYGSWMDPVERAIYEGSLSIGTLRRKFEPQDRGDGINRPRTPYFIHVTRGLLNDYPRCSCRLSCFLPI